LRKEAIRSYKVPLEAPIDLMEEYLRIKSAALEDVLKHVKCNGKAHLNFSTEERRELRDKLLKDWRYSKHYVDSAINSAISLAKGWIKLYNRGKARSRPKVTRKVVYIKSTLFSYRDGVIRISIEPKKRYLEVDLRKYDWIPKDFDGIGGLLLTEKELIITVKKKVELKEPKSWASFDVNLTNVTALIDDKIVRYDLKQLYHVHRVYELKRQRIQKMAKKKPKTASKLMEKYSKRERDRSKDIMQKLTTKIARELAELGIGAILEDLKNIKRRILRNRRDVNNKLSKWNARTFQFMLSYKLIWMGIPVRYVNPANTSRTCPLCSGSMAAYGGRSMKCKKCGLILDRDVVAVLNLRMWGSGVTPNALLEAFASMMGKQLAEKGSLPMKVCQL